VKRQRDNRLKLAYHSFAPFASPKRSRSHFDVLVRMLDDPGKELHAPSSAAAQKSTCAHHRRLVVARALGVIAKRSLQEASVLFVKLGGYAQDNDGFITGSRPWCRATLKSADRLRNPGSGHSRTMCARPEA